MREILFRGKRIDNGEWVDGHLCKDGFGKMYIINYVPTKYNNVLPERKVICVYPKTVCQFTGLTDKNGNKIWENDVCQYVDSDEYEAEFVVKYGRREDYQGINLGFYIEWLDTDDGYRSDICFWTEDRDVEVIGNIHDNPELMEGGVADET